jgi:NAD(P)-dependent dehydrogenase (short-subunit alcohol dehydrogenase family)
VTRSFAALASRLRGSKKLPDAPRVLVTGAASGLGRAIALRLAERRARIVVADVHLERAQETASAVRNQGGEAVVVACDVTRIEDVERAAAEALARWAGIDLLVNNAGVAAGGEVGSTPLHDWQWLLGVNLWGVIHGCHVCVPHMRAAGRGWILNVSSCAGVVSLPKMAAYNVSKAGVVSLSETLRAELAPHGIAVSVLCPTFFESNLMETFRSPNHRERRLAESLFRSSRTTADDVARAGLDGLERGRLVIIPQRAGGLLWRLKRLSPPGFHGILGNARLWRLFERALAPERD